MGLSGETIRKIREALKSAFPNRDELVMMLHMELDIPESEVPNNSNYNLVVFNLIQQLDSQNRIPELIKGALNRANASKFYKITLTKSEVSGVNVIIGFIALAYFSSKYG